MKLNCEEVSDLAGGYVLGALTPAEAAAVRDHLQGCPEAHREIEELGGVVPYLAEAIEPVEPPAQLKQRILAAAAADYAERRSAGDVRSATSDEDRPARVDARAGNSTAAWEMPGPLPRVPEARRPSPLAWLAGMAMVVAVIALGGLSYLLVGDLQTAREYEQGVAAVLELAAQDGSQLAILTGDTGDGPRGMAAIGPDGRVAIAMREMPATSGSQVYEAWVIAGDSAPTPIGSFQVGAHGTGTLLTGTTTPPEGVTLAITLEPTPGASSPTGPIVASGAAAEPGS